MRPPYTCVYREMWDDERFYTMADPGRIVYIYLLSCPMGNGLGCFKAGKAAMIEESRTPSKRFNEGFREGLSKGLYEYNPDARVILIPKYFERNPPSNPNGIKAMSKEFVKIPACDMKLKCFHIVREWVEMKRESFAEPFKELFKEPFAEPFKEQPGTISPSCSPSCSPSDPTTPPGGFLVVNGIEWIDPALWKEWVAHKRQVKASITDRALKANVTELEKLGKGIANKILAQSLDNGWKGLFELKGPSKGGKQSVYDNNMVILNNIGVSNE